MNAPGLQLGQAPPLSVPLRFFLTAPLFALLAAGTLLWHGPAALASRWTAPMLALTHFFTLGFLTTVMFGALMQMLPVLAGAPLARPRLVSAAVHIPLTLGVLLLGAGLLGARPDTLLFAMPLIGTGLFVFTAAATWNLWRVKSGSATVIAMRLALAALALTVVLGLALGLGASARIGLPAQQAWTNVHLAWGLIGWVALLVIGVAYQVVPMFQLTPSYPAWLRHGLALLVFAALIGWSAAAVVAPGRLAETVFGLLVALGLATFAGTTLYLQHRRRRRLPDVTLNFWRLSMASLLAAVLLWLAATGGGFASERLTLALGALVILGFAASAIHGMLYKIVPFLLWLHLHGRQIRYPLPNMTISPGVKLDAHSAPEGRSPRMANVKEIMPDRRTLPHLWIHLAAILAALAACVLPAIFVYPAALLLLLSFGWLEWNLVSAVRRYRHTVRAHASGSMHVA
ncbi:MAG: hypothetical protein A2V91_06545 [Candidatus Muproteobacteria bacterium RBG_16_64_10]|uniref:Uncharacterized protein n=1 Tax=Candidatus Muproteobacteria bacterium RBG_16_64_10 TaxID=1817757 RepID=A0A1F6T2R8_9PROT|nr:MAG: hypothetical protein A2V91_06545 [Candidatus Muproteobacteria bacterium RBG_16_64_10]